MSITTRSQFFYGFTIDTTNFSIDFSEGGGELQASLNVGTYSLTEFLAEIARAMNLVGGQEYTVVVDRSNRQITISAAGNFELLADTGSRVGTGTWVLMGFVATDLSGAATYEGTNGAGSVYRPQAILTNYVPFEDSNTSVDAAIHESASGIIEAITFGERRMMECNIWLIKDTAVALNKIEADANARQNARDFMIFATKKGKMEFMEDRDTPGTFFKCLLEKTAQDGKGLDYKIKLFTPKGTSPHYQTGDLVFREVA